MGYFGMQRDRLAHRRGMGVLDNGRHAGQGRRGRPGRKVFTLGGSRIHQVDVRIHHPRHDEQIRGIDADCGALALDL